MLKSTFFYIQTGEHTYFTSSSMCWLFHFFSKAATTCRSHSRRFFALSAPRRCMRSAAVVERHTPPRTMLSGMTNYRIGPHRTTWEREQNIQILIIQNGQCYERRTRCCYTVIRTTISCWWRDRQSVHVLLSVATSAVPVRNSR